MARRRPGPWRPAVVAWLAMLVIAALAGGAREWLLTPRLGAHRAQQVETLALCAAFAFGIVVFVQCTRPRPRDAIVIGGAWVAATLVFEFGFFGLVMGVQWADLLAAYDLGRGRLWPLVLATLGLTPWLSSLAVDERG